MKVGLQISSFTWPGGARGDRPDARPDRPPGRRRRGRLDLGHGPLLPDPRERPARGADARGDDRARLHGRPLPAGAARADGRRHPLPPARACGSRRPRRSTCCRAAAPGSGIGAAWNDEESRALGFPFPPLGERFEMLEETLQIAHGMFQGERGSEASFQGRHFRAERLLNSPQSLSRPQGADHGRRRRRAEDAPPRGPVRRRLQRLRRTRGHRPQVPDPRRALRRGRARPERDRALDPPGRPPVDRAPTATASRRPRSSIASGSCPTPAPSTSSSTSRRSTSRPGWRRSAGTCVPRLQAL